MNYLKQSTTTTIQLGPFLDETDGKSAEESLTISSTDVWLSKAGAAFANPNDTNAAAHDRAGWYRKQLNTTDTGTLGRFIVSVHESGALPVWREFMILPANVYDSLVAGSDYLEVDIEAVSGDETAADNLELMYDGTGYAGGTTLLDVNIEAVSGDASAATNLESDYDGAGYEKANSTIGTCTSNTDMISEPPTAVQNRQEMDTNSTKLADIAADTNELQTDDTPAAIAALPTAVQNRQEMDSNSTKLADIAADTNELQVDDVPGLIAALNDPTAVSIADAVWEEAIADHSGTSGSTAEALDGASAPTAAAVADAVWDEAIGDHLGAPSTGKRLNDAFLHAEIADSNTDAILLDTDELQSDDVPGLIAALNDLSAAEVNAEVDTALSDIHLDHLLAADYDPASKPGVATALLNELVENDSGASRFTENSLEQAPSGTGASAATIADAVWDEAIGDHLGAPSTGKALNDAKLHAEIADSNTDAILLDTDELQSDDVPGLIAALNDPTAGAIADQVWEEAIADHSGTSGSTAEALDSAAAPTAGAIADQVWEEALSDHSGTSGSTAEALSQIPGATKGAVEYTYTIDDGVNPIDGAEVWITTDSGGNNVIWSGVSDALGAARASDDEKPWLDAGTYYGWAQKAGYSFSNPDTLAVS